MRPFSTQRGERPLRDPGDKELWSKIPVIYIPEREGGQKQYEEIMPPNPPNLMETGHEQITDAYDVTSRINAKKPTRHIRSNCCKAVKKRKVLEAARGESARQTRMRTRIQAETTDASSWRENTVSWNVTAGKHP